MNWNGAPFLGMVPYRKSEGTAERRKAKVLVKSLQLMEFRVRLSH
jgi:hypothetical protein